MIRVLVIDDSAFSRKALSLMIEKDAALEVAGTARDGEEGFRKFLELQPDIVTLDLEMPRTNGLSCIRMIVEHGPPVPILVISSQSSRSAQATFEALKAGAADFIPKPQAGGALTIKIIEQQLVEKIKTLVREYSANRNRRDPAGQSDMAATEFVDLSQVIINCVAIGVSTGGPAVVESILSSLPADIGYSVLVAQHMPFAFTAAFANRLNEVSTIHVKEAEDGEELQAGTAYIGRGGQHLMLRGQGAHVYTALLSEPDDGLYPSADLLFESSARRYGRKLLALILTGMGRDGVQGLRSVQAAGGTIIAQDRKSSVVFGMPGAAVKAGLPQAVLNVDGLIKTLATVH